MNLNSRDTNSRNYEDTAFWTGAGNVGTLGSHFTQDYRGPGFASRTGLTSVMLMAHTNGAMVSWATWDVLSSHASQTLRDLLLTGSDLVLTGNRVAHGGTMPTRTNRRRDSYGAPVRDSSGIKLIGDIFLGSRSDVALVLNQDEGFGSDGSGVNNDKRRIGTTLLTGATSIDGHCYAGIGGRHYDSSHNRWRILYESAPISPYCPVQEVYGSASTMDQGQFQVWRISPGGYDPYHSCNSGVAFAGYPPATFYPIDFALFVRANA